MLQRADSAALLVFFVRFPVILQIEVRDKRRIGEG
jgi:hypothetical protein